MHVDANDQGGQINDAMQAVITWRPVHLCGRLHPHHRHGCDLDQARLHLRRRRGRAPQGRHLGGGGFR